MQGAALYPVKSDVSGNMRKVRNSCERFNVWTIDEMLSKEQEAGVAKKDSSGSVGLLWLSRTVDLILESMVELIKDPDGKMCNLVRIAYDRTLKPYHSRVMALLFSSGLKLFPDTNTFLLNLAYNKPNMNEKVMLAINDFLQTYGKILRPIQMLLTEYNVA
nr:glycolipid transfer protein HET C2 [Hymenolepis microstoma]